jgi:hypothetical protein
MSNYYQFESNFETGNFTEWTAGEASDAEARLSVDFYADFVNRYPFFIDPIPFRGSYMLHGDLSISGTADAYVQDTTFATALGGTAALRFYFQATSDLVMAASDRLTIAALQSTTPTDEVVICLRNSAGTYQLLISETSAGATVVATPVSLGVWHCVEVVCVVDTGPNDGAVDFYLDGALVGSLASLDQAALIHLRMGIMGKDAGTTAGHLLFDAVAGGIARIGPYRSRWEELMIATKSIFLAQGPGTVQSYTLVSGGGVDNHLTLYDMDKLPLPIGAEFIAPPIANEYAFQAVNGATKHIYFNRGLYAVMSGTAPRAAIRFGQAHQDVGLVSSHAMRRDR